MRKLPKSLICCTLCVAAATTFAETYDSSSTSASDKNRDEVRASDSSKAAESMKFFKSKDLVGADIKDQQGNKLGDISELVVNHMNGETFATVGLSGNRFAVVPIQAFHVTRPAGMIRNAEVTLNTTKQELESGPTLAKDEWNKLDTPSFVQSIYSHYHVRQSAMGGSDANSLGGSSKGAELNQNSSSDLSQPGNK